jgi:hypothetical protein
MTPITVTTEFFVSPKAMAEAFWGMSSDKQAEFFSELAKTIAADNPDGHASTSIMGEYQWFWLGDELNRPENQKARDTLMSMAAPLYLNTLRYAGQIT